MEISFLGQTGITLHSFLNAGILCQLIYLVPFINFSKKNHPKAISASFLALVPKVENLQLLSEYRPISLLGSLYKIIAKLLANKLRLVVGKLVSKSELVLFPKGKYKMVSWY